jgi:methionyl aminopeptidase
MIQYKSAEEIQIIRENCLLVCQTLAHVASLIKPGITSLQLDHEAEKYIRDHGAEPGFKGYRGFPATLCFSFNEQVVHGIPSERRIEEGDILSVDCGVFTNDFYGDAAYTFAVGDVSAEVEELLVATRTALYLGIEAAVVGNRIGDISSSIQEYAERKHPFEVVRALVGHGIGRELHEPPEVPNFGKRGRGIMLKEGLVIAIEPMVNLGTGKVRVLSDGWTIISKDKSPSAHFEHTIAIHKDGPDILSDHEPIGAAVKKNANLKDLSIKSEIFALRNF